MLHNVMFHADFNIPIETEVTQEETTTKIGPREPMLFYILNIYT